MCVVLLLYGDHRYLHRLTHSVPARRSSDLGVVWGIGWFRGGSGIAGWWWGRGAIGERSEGLMGLGRVAIASGLAVVCAGCSGMSVDRDLPRGSAAYGVIPAPDAGATAAA